jgi:6,7-dimethyl-8-ribityllumazine synthase
MKTIEGQLVASGLKFAVVVARFNSFLTEHLKEGAIDTIVRHGGNREDISVVYVPGSYEIPLACKSLAQSKRYDAVVALGAVIKGATSHYDLVCSEVSKGISSVMLQTGVPIGFGVITVDSIEQGIERSGTKAGNKGVDAAIAAIEMTNLLRTLG